MSPVVIEDRLDMMGLDTTEFAKLSAFEDLWSAPPIALQFRGLRRLFQRPAVFLIGIHEP
jgi:hypothetical protein